MEDGGGSAKGGKPTRTSFYIKSNFEITWTLALGGKLFTYPLPLKGQPVCLT